MSRHGLGGRRRQRATMHIVTAVCAVSTLGFSVSSTLGSDSAPAPASVQQAAAAPAAASQPAAEAEAAAQSAARGARAQAGAAARSSAAGAAPTSAAPSAAASSGAAPSGAAPTAAASSAAGSASSAGDAGAASTSGGAAAGSATTGSTTGSTSGSTSGSTTSTAAAAGAGTSALVPSGTWLSGASGTGVASGQFAAWRGSPLGIAGTWADSNTGQVQLWQLHPGGEFGSWSKSLDIAIGAIDKGETWAQAATGAYDARWRTSLTNLRDAWGSRPGTLYIRFAHEMNGNWYPWSVNASNAGDFMTAWKRFRALQQEIFPSSKLVFCVNRESVGAGVDWRKTFPGAKYVDVLGVDYYNNYPYVASQAQWDSSMDDTDGTGAPKGLQQHLDFARSVGLPLAVPEWSGKASEGDSPAYISAMHDFFAGHAGGGAGQLLYEVQFNVDMHNNDYRLYGGTRMPSSAARYQEAF